MKNIHSNGQKRDGSMMMIEQQREKGQECLAECVKMSLGHQSWQKTSDVVVSWGRMMIECVLVIALMCISAEAGIDDSVDYQIVGGFAVPTSLTAEQKMIATHFSDSIKENVKASTVFITGRGSRGAWTGTGFIVNTNGYILTNHHVVEDALKMVVEFVDGTKIPVDYVLAASEANDVAVIKVRPGPYAHLAPEKPENIHVDDEVFVLGHPMGVKYVSFYGKILDKGFFHSQFRRRKELQISADLYHGTSGSAYINTNGLVVGINAWGKDDTDFVVKKVRHNGTEYVVGVEKVQVPKRNENYGTGVPHLFEVLLQARSEDLKPPAQKKTPAQYTAMEKRGKLMADLTDLMSMMLMETGEDLADIRLGLERMRIYVTSTYSSTLHTISGHPKRVASSLNIYNLESLAQAVDAFAVINRFVRSLEMDKLFESDPHLRAGFRELHSCLDEARLSILCICDAEGLGEAKGKAKVREAKVHFNRSATHLMESMRNVQGARNKYMRLEGWQYYNVSAEDFKQFYEAMYASLSSFSTE